MQHKFTKLFCFAAAFATALVAHAAVLFDSSTGQGFIGRGDVIDNPTLGKNALVQSPAVTFEMTMTYEVVVEWATGPVHNRKTHTITRNVSLNVAAATEVDTRNAKGNGNISGYRLLGYTEEAQVQAAFTPPQVGDVILDNDHIAKVVTEVSALSSTGGQLKFAALPTVLVGWFSLP